MVEVVVEVVEIVVEVVVGRGRGRGRGSGRGSDRDIRGGRGRGIGRGSGRGYGSSGSGRDIRGGRGRGRGRGRRTLIYPHNYQSKCRKYKSKRFSTCHAADSITFSNCSFNGQSYIQMGSDHNISACMVSNTLKYSILSTYKCI